MSARTILTISICNFHFFILFVLLFFSFRRGSVTAAYAQLFVLLNALLCVIFFYNDLAF